MPLIRYETEDLTTTEFIDENNFTIKDIIGRKADMVEGKNGAIISPSSFHHYWKYKTKIPILFYFSFYLKYFLTYHSITNISPNY